MVDDHDLGIAEQAGQIVGLDRGIAVDADRQAGRAQQLVGHRCQGLVRIDE
ncbi:hypothetical protein ACVWXQ_004782 [Bradyrhizobium sp. S3.14.4]